MIADNHSYKKWTEVVPPWTVVAAIFWLPVACAAQSIPSPAAIDTEVNGIMSRTQAKGMAVAVVDRGKVGYVRAYGLRNAKGDLLTSETVMYGASLTKAVFAYAVMQLVDRGQLDLDTPLKNYLERPLPDYGPDPVFRTNPVPIGTCGMIHDGRGLRLACV